LAVARAENFRQVPWVDHARGTAFIVKRDPVMPEPVGTIVLMAFRITGYEPDCDGSLMAQFECIDTKGESTGWEPRQIGIYPDVDLVVTLDEWRSMFEPHNAQSSQPEEQ